MSLSDIEKTSLLVLIGSDVLFILALVGFLTSVSVFVSHMLYPYTGVMLGYSEGFSMCPAENPGLDYLALGDMHCAYAPGDVLIIYRTDSLQPGDIACAYLPKYGNVCHEVTKVSPDGTVVFQGSNPRGRLVASFNLHSDQYLGKVVGKLPRAFGIPGIAFTLSRDLVAQFLFQLNVGGYPAGRVG